MSHSVPKTFICCCSGRDSCMLTSRCMLPWLRSIPYPALCPCEPRPVGDMQAVSYGARSRQYSPLLPASSSQPRSIVERPRSGPMGRILAYIYTSIYYCCKSFPVLLHDVMWVGGSLRTCSLLFFGLGAAAAAACCCCCPQHQY